MKFKMERLAQQPADIQNPSEYEEIKQIMINLELESKGWYLASFGDLASNYCEVWYDTDSKAVGLLNFQGRWLSEFARIGKKKAVIASASISPMSFSSEDLEIQQYMGEADPARILKYCKMMKLEDSPQDFDSFESRYTEIATHVLQSTMQELEELGIDDCELDGCEDEQDFPYTEEINKYRETRSFKECFEELLKLIKEKAPSASLKLLPPASEDEINLFEKKVGMELPDDLKELYMIANGQNFDGIPLFSDFYLFIPLDRSTGIIEMIRKCNQGIEEMLDDEDCEEELLVKEFSISFNRIPFAAVGGDTICIDFEPGPLGQQGQVICGSSGADCCHVGYTFTDFIGEYVAGIKSGKYFYDEEVNSFLEEE